MNAIQEIIDKGYIELMKADFNDVDDLNNVHRQFISPCNCPIARALKRIGAERPLMGVHWVGFSFKGKPYSIKFNGRQTEIVKVATEISQGAESGKIYIDKPCEIK